MTSLMTSQDHKVGHILKLINLRQYLSYSVDQKLKMSEMSMAIFLVYSTVWYKTKFGSQNLATKFGNHLCMATKIGSQCYF